MTDQPANDSPPPAPAQLEQSGVAPEDAAPRKRFGINFTGISRAVLIRPFGIVAMVGIGIGVWMPSTGLGPSTCGMQKNMGLPCPGCGLTRSVSSFFDGQFAWSFQFHPMGWMFAVAMIASAVFALLPGKWREPVLAKLDPHDNKVGWLLITFVSVLIGYGLLRLGFVVWDVPGYDWWRGDGTTPPPFVD